MANTKLTREQKSDLKTFKAVDMPARNIELLNLNNATVMAFADRGNTVEFSLAVMSSDEEKFRVKVGEFLALTRFSEGSTVKMERMDFMFMCETVWGAYPLL